MRGTRTKNLSWVGVPLRLPAEAVPFSRPGPGRFLGAPKGEAAFGRDGLIRREFEGASVSLNISAFVPAANPADAGLNRGCVRWAGGGTTGSCP